MPRISNNRYARVLSKVYFGWWIVAVSVIADGLKHGSFNRGFTIFVVPIRTDLGVGVAAISIADMLGRLTGSIQGPIVGYLTDRWGPRLMLIIGAILSGLGFICLAFVRNYTFFLLIFVGLLSAGFRSGYNSASLTAINRWFRRKRAFAMSIVSIGNGLGGSLVLLTGSMVNTFGWRPVAFVYGILIIGIICPLSIIVRDHPENMGLLPDGDKPNPNSEYQSNSDPEELSSNHTFPEWDFTAREAMITHTYWWIVLPVGLSGAVHSGMRFLLAPVLLWFLSESNRSEESNLLIASIFVTVMAFSTIVSNPSIGWLGDHVSKQKLSAICMLCGAGSLLLLVNQNGNLYILTMFCGLMSIAESSNPLAWAVMGDCFGRKSFATLRGWQNVPDQLMAMSTPVWMGLIYDSTGSYYWALLPLFALYVFAAILFWTIPRPHMPSRLKKQETSLI